MNLCYYIHRYSRTDKIILGLRLLIIVYILFQYLHRMLLQQHSCAVKCLHFLMQSNQQMPRLLLLLENQANKDLSISYNLQKIFCQ